VKQFTWFDYVYEELVQHCEPYARKKSIADLKVFKISG